MPVRKFRSVEEMNQLVWRRAGDPELFRAIAGVWTFSRRANPRRFPPGVLKFRSIEEMSMARDAAIAEHVTAIQRQRHGSTPLMPAFLDNGLQVVDQALIDDVVRRIVERFRPKRIVLFGSHARGDAGPESDIDLFIEMESDQRPIDRAVDVLRLFGLRRWGLDVFVYTPAEVAAHRGRIGSLLAYVDAEGKVLYER